MKLPSAHLALVDPEKIVDYLLNPAHPDNGGKAAFFVALGFSRDQWQPLARKSHTCVRGKPACWAREISGLPQNRAFLNET